MNMHGIIEPVELGLPARPSAARQALAWIRRNRVLLLVVVVPSLLVASYLYLVASDQYESEAHFLVHGADATPQPGVGVSQVISMATGVSAGQNEAMSVADYLTSHDAVERLRREDGLVEKFRHAGIDPLSRLSSDNPTPERLLAYYRKQVKVEYNTETGITVLTVHGFTPGDAYELARKLLQMGEERVNQLNVRSYQDAVSVGQVQLASAERDMTANQVAMTRFRQGHADIDPQASGQAQIGLVTNLTGQLAAVRAQLNAMRGLINSDSPQVRALQSRVRSLSAELAGQTGRLTGSGRTIAGDMGGYEGLKMRQEFLAKRYDAAASALQQARERAMRQQLYVVRVVNANLPVKSLFPQRFRILATVFVSLLLIYSIGWLIAAGVREHAA
ncbi:lipopolysaccharide biosynthesis protein [Sphingomonas sp. CROZ-RG-20F-R02-07]|uniref:lipopolysaccharide biosynthesis protein n=1 Tax=Sphingomonas sp. CROZ-RG-20F-R02-07 TaxID=2914832 RepID=UPI001F57CAD7|nr:lipopolysaccharide biosynthesis protein [Sphingomonas sp. CROZ-RG-20F-R02-07]